MPEYIKGDLPRHKLEFEELPGNSEFFKKGSDEEIEKRNQELKTEVKKHLPPVEWDDLGLKVLGTDKAKASLAAAFEKYEQNIAALPLSNNYVDPNNPYAYAYPPQPQPMMQPYPTYPQMPPMQYQPMNPYGYPMQPQYPGYYPQQPQQYPQPAPNDEEEGGTKK